MIANIYNNRRFNWTFDTYCNCYASPSGATTFITLGIHPPSPEVHSTDHIYARLRLPLHKVSERGGYKCCRCYAPPGRGACYYYKGGRPAGACITVSIHVKSPGFKSRHNKTNQCGEVKMCRSCLIFVPHLPTEFFQNKGHRIYMKNNAPVIGAWPLHGVFTLIF